MNKEQRARHKKEMSGFLLVKDKKATIKFLTSQ